MSKKIIGWLVVFVVVVLVGYLLVKNGEKTQNEAAKNKQNSTTQINKDDLPLSIGAPEVDTSQNFTASMSTALLNGQVKPNGMPTTYWFEYGDNTAMLNKTKIQQVGSGFSYIPATAFITNLKSNTLYYYRLSANSDISVVNGITYNFKTNNNPPPKAVLPTVTTNSASDITSNSATINGKINPGGLHASYWFEYGKDSKFGNITSLKQTDDSGSLKTTVSVSDSFYGLESNTKYYFRLSAQNQFGIVSGVTTSFTTKK